MCTSISNPVVDEPHAPCYTTHTLIVIGSGVLLIKGGGRAPQKSAETPLCRMQIARCLCSAHFCFPSITRMKPIFRKAFAVFTGQKLALGNLDALPRLIIICGQHGIKCKVTSRIPPGEFSLDWSASLRLSTILDHYADSYSLISSLAEVIRVEMT